RHCSHKIASEEKNCIPSSAISKVFPGAQQLVSHRFLLSSQNRLPTPYFISQKSEQMCKFRIAG
ncbi:MAG: hypothetical protein ACP5QU_11545, partial [Anaerolineae bacterium]